MHIQRLADYIRPSCLHYDVLYVLVFQITHISETANIDCELHCEQVAMAKAKKKKRIYFVLFCFVYPPAGISHKQAFHVVIVIVHVVAKLDKNMHFAFTIQSSKTYFGRNMNPNHSLVHEREMYTGCFIRNLSLLISSNPPTAA